MFIPSISIKHFFLGTTHTAQKNDEESIFQKKIANCLADIGYQISDEQFKDMLSELKSKITVSMEPTKMTALIETYLGSHGYEKSKKNYFEQLARRSSLDLSKAIDFAHQGRIIMKQILEGQKKDLPKEKKKQEMVSVVWWMFYCAIFHEKDVGFEQGTFVFKDPEHKVIRYFSNAAMSRNSTHFKGRWLPIDLNGEKQITTLGMDLTCLPNNHRTVNFAPIQMLDNIEDWSFLKPENYGLGEDWSLQSLMEFAWHSLDYIKTRFFPSSSSTDRKEHIPSELLSRFNGILKQMKPEANISMEQKWEALEKFGITGMVKILQTLLTVARDKTKIEIEQFLKLLESTYGEDIEVAKGKEVILDNFFLNPSKECCESLEDHETDWVVILA